MTSSVTDPAPAATAARIPWLDHLKCLAMLLVVYGHAGILNPWVDRWIYSFHMPIFFLISGYLLRNEYLAERWPDFFSRVVRSLLPAYLIFAFFNYGFWLLLRRFGPNADLSIPPSYPLLAIFYGTGTPARFHLQPVILWFFPCLFSAQLLVYLAERAGARMRAVWSLAMAVVGFVLPKWLALPMELETALVAQLFLALGIAARRTDFLARLRPRWPLAILALALGTFLALNNERVDMRVSTFGNPLMFLGASLALSLGLALVLQRLPSNRVSDAVARNTIVIFPLHPFVFTVFVAILLLVFHRDANFRNLPAVALATSLVNCTLLVLAAPIIQRVLPVVYGLKKKRPAAVTSGVG